jgi:hypothetical protein
LKGEPYNFNGVRYQDLLADGTLVAGDKCTHTVEFIGMDGEMKLMLGTPGSLARARMYSERPKGSRCAAAHCGFQIRATTEW